MSYKIAIASGKGGTGKTTVSVNLYKYLSEKLGHNVHLTDCDVEEPNALIFFEEAKLVSEENINQLIPEINLAKCTYCRKCDEYCEFNAISILPSVHHASIDASLCHSCGACLVACTDDAITEHPQPIGKLYHYTMAMGSGLTVGKLNVGSAMQTTVIRKTKASADDHYQVSLYDAPPGTSCPVVETIADSNYVVLVTEPTPFGFHDIQLMIELVNDLKIPFGIVINKAGLGNNEVKDYLIEHHYEILGELPFMKSYARNYSKGQIFQNIPMEIEDEFQKITDRLLSNIKQP